MLRPRRAGLFPQYEWQNRKFGTENDEFSFADRDREVIDKVKRQIKEGQPVDLTWEMNLGKTDNGVPMYIELEFRFGKERPTFAEFNNLPEPK